MHCHTSPTLSKHSDPFAAIISKRSSGSRRPRQCAPPTSNSQHSDIRASCIHRDHPAREALVQHLGAAVAAVTVLLSPNPAQASPVVQTTGQGELLSQLLEQNAGKGIKALGPGKQTGAFQDFAPQRLVSDAGSGIALPSSAIQTDNPVEKAADQAKGVAKKFQQSTPKGAPTKPQPLQKAGPLEAAKEAIRPGPQLADSEGSFKFKDPVSRGGSQGSLPAGIELPTPKGSKEGGSGPNFNPNPIKRSQFFQSGSSAASNSQAKAQELSQQVKDTASDAAPSGNFLTKLLSKPEQATDAATNKATSAAVKSAGSAAASKAGSAAADKAQEAVPSSNLFSKLLSKPEQLASSTAEKAGSAADKAQDAAPSSNPFSKLLTKPDQFASSAADKAKRNAPAAKSKAEDVAKDAVPSSNPFGGLLGKPSQAADAVKEAAPSGNPLTNLLSKPSQPAEAAKEAAPASNPFSGLLTKPQQTAQAASSKVKQASGPAADKASEGGNPFNGLLSKPKQAADKGQSAAQQAGTGAAVAGAATAAGAAADAIKSNVTGAGFETSLPSPPSIPDATGALQSASDAASNMSLPDAPSLVASGSGLQQAGGLVAAEVVAALVALNVVGSLTAKKSGVKA